MNDVWPRLSELVQNERAALAALARSEGVSAEDAIDAVQDGLCALLARSRRGELPEESREWGPMGNY